MLLVLSLTGNFVIIVVLFFKSALNEIVVHWFKERTRRREKTHDILRELNQHMTVLQRNHFQLMLGLGLIQMATTAADQALARETFDEARRQIEQTNEFLDQHELEFPQSVGVMIADLRRATQLPANAVARVLSRDEILQRNDAITAVIERIRAEVVKLVA